MFSCTCNLDLLIEEYRKATAWMQWWKTEKSSYFRVFAPGGGGGIGVVQDSSADALVCLVLERHLFFDSCGPSQAKLYIIASRCMSGLGISKK